MWSVPDLKITQHQHDRLILYDDTMKAIVKYFFKTSTGITGTLNSQG